jgi:hypothetical protein
VRKQIPLQYAGISVGYGLPRMAHSGIGQRRNADIRSTNRVGKRQSPIETDSRAKLPPLRKCITDS